MESNKYFDDINLNLFFNLIFINEYTVKIDQYYSYIINFYLININKQG